MKIKLLLFLMLLIAPNNKLFMQEIPDCMCPPQHWIEDNSFLYNYERIVLDTCGINFYSNKCDSAYWLNYDNNIFSRLYATNYWDIHFDVEAIPMPAYQDTIIWVTWENIDTAYNEIRNKFQDLENIHGEFKLLKSYPGISSEYDAGRSFMLYFIDSNYHHIDTIKEFIDTIPNTDCWFGRYLYHSGKTYITDGDDHREINIFPNPASEYIEISYSKINPRVNPWIDDILDFQIYNVYGKQMPVGAINELSLRIDISPLTVGVYFIRIGDVVKSFVKL